MNIYDEAGRLTEEGKKATLEFRAMANGLLLIAKNQNEARMVGSLLSSIVGDLTSNHVRDFIKSK